VAAAKTIFDSREMSVWVLEAGLGEVCPGGVDRERDGGKRRNPIRDFVSFQGGGGHFLRNG
jgi:hypothetical protein